MSAYPTTSADVRVAILEDLRRHGAITHAEAEELATLQDVLTRLDQQRQSTKNLVAAGERLRREHRATLDAVNAELLEARTQVGALAVMYGKARLDADKAQANAEGLAQRCRQANDERDEARQALADAVKAGNALSDSLGREAAEMRQERDGFKDAWGTANDEIEALKESLETLKDAATLRDAVRSLIDTENARRRFTNERRAEDRHLKRPPLRLIPRP